MIQGKSQKKILLQGISLESWLEKWARAIFYVLAAGFLIFSLLYFNARASIAGDDSTYITRALNFWQTGKFPTYQGPLYPMVLSLFVGLFGMNLIVLKISSLVFNFIAFVLFFKAYKGRVSYTSLFYALGILSVSNYFLFFSSQTFSEAFFMMLQAFFFVLVFKYVDKNQDADLKYSKHEIQDVGLIVLFAGLMFITRTIGFGAVLALVIFFLVYGQYKRAVVVLLGFVLLVMLFVGIKSVFWDLPSNKGMQTAQLLNKNPYDSSKGKEDVAGFVQRFKDNSNLYLSKHFMRIVGFKAISKNTINPAITIMLYVVFLLGFFWFPKRNKYLFFTAVYLAIMLGITFFSLQRLWDQCRLIIPLVPFVLLFLVSVVFQVSKEKNNKIIIWILPLFLCVSLGFSLKRGVETIDLETLSKNIRGDKLAGFTPDWISYLQMVDYVERNLGEDSAYVACRKPNIARIYGKGRKFYGVYRIPEGDAVELVRHLKRNKITHIMMASLRKTPQQYTGETINTIKRYMSVVVNEYPEIFKLEKMYGDEEPCYLFKIDYSQLDNRLELNSTVEGK